MRMLLTADDLAPVGGVEWSTLQVGRELSARGHRCDLLYVRDGSLGAQWRDFTATTTQVPGFTVAARTPWRTLHHLPRSVAAGRAARPDVIYLNRAEQLPWAALTAARPRVPVLAHLRHHPFPAPLVRLLRRRAGAYLAVSHWIRDEWIAAGLESHRVQVVHNGVDPRAYRPPAPGEREAARAALGIDPAAQVALHYGRLTVDKGVPDLIDAWRRRPAGPGRLLLLAGTADADTARALATAAGPDIRVLPTRDDVRPLLHAADLAVVPSRWPEPFGRVVIEAMSAGLPVVATRVGGVPEILTGRFAAGLVDSGDRDALAGRLAEPAAWRHVEPDLGVAARQHVQANFDIRTTVDGVETALASLVGHPGRARRPAGRSSGIVADLAARR